MLSFSTIFEIDVPFIGSGGHTSGQIDVPIDDDDDQNTEVVDSPTPGTNTPSIFTTRNVLLGLGGLGLAGAGSMIYSDYLDSLKQKKEKEQNVHPYFRS